MESMAVILKGAAGAGLGTLAQITDAHHRQPERDIVPWRTRGARAEERDAFVGRSAAVPLPASAWAALS